MDKNSILLQAVPFLKKWEGLSLKAYTDQGGRVTIGYGHTGGVQVGDLVSQEKADELLLKDASYALDKVMELVIVPISINQAVALTSFVFNLGPNNLKRSGLLKYLNLKDYRQAADQFLLWNHIGLYVNSGLTTRREAERSLFLKD